MAHARRRLRALEDFCTQIETGIEALPEFFRLLRTYVDSDHGAYFHADRHGLARFRMPLANAPMFSVRGA